MHRAVQYEYPFDKVVQDGNAVSKAIFIGSFRNQIVSLYVSGANAEATVRVRISGQENYPMEIDQTASADNMWTYADLALSNNAGAITDGDTGLIITAPGVYQFEVNQNGFSYMAIELSGVQDATIEKVVLSLSSNQ